MKKLPDAEKDREIERIARELKVEMPDAPPDANAPLSWEQAREMNKSGINIESHTVTHPDSDVRRRKSIEFRVEEIETKTGRNAAKGNQGFLLSVGRARRKRLPRGRTKRLRMRGDDALRI